MRQIALSVLLLLGGLTVVAGATPVVPYVQNLDDIVLVDGYVDRDQAEREYPFEFVDQATGITVSWGYDDTLLYVALETKGRGWFGIGFGSPTMNGSNMVIGFDTDDETDVLCLIGRGHSHKVVASADELLPEWDVDFDDETGVTTLEFAYPLRWRGEGAPAEFAAFGEAFKGAAVGGLEPGDVYDAILAQNTKTASLDAKHTHLSSFKFRMGDIPKTEDSGQ